jgi:ketosteroid isomerase-like protein
MCHVEAAVDILRRALEHYARTGAPPLDLYTDDVVFVTRGELAGRGEFRGHEGVARALRDYAESWSDMRPELLGADETAAGPLVTLIRWHLTARSGVTLDVDEGWLIWFRDGRISRLEQYASREEAEAAAA